MNEIFPPPLAGGAVGGGAGSVADRIHDRYRTPLPTPGPWSAAIDLMLQHRSVRAYLPDALPTGTLEAIVAAAQSAPTSSNLQAWSVVAVEDQAARDHLAELAGRQRHIATAPLFLVFIADLARAARLGEAGGVAMETLGYTEAFLVAVVDAALAAQNASLAAQSLGLGIVYIGGMRNHPEAVAAALGLPQGAFAVFGLCVGHIDPAAPPAAVKPRLPQSVVLHRERYSAELEAEHLPAYDGALTTFQAEQGMARQPWSDLIRRRLGPLSGLSGRETLRQSLEVRGFPLY